MKNMSSRII